MTTGKKEGTNMISEGGWLPMREFLLGVGFTLIFIAYIVAVLVIAHIDFKEGDKE